MIHGLLLAPKPYLRPSIFVFVLYESFESDNKKARYALHIGLNQSVIKASDALIMIFFELLYSY